MHKILFYLFIFLGFSINAQQKVEGKIYDLVSDEPISDATVKVVGTDIFTTTNEYGIFSLTISANAQLEISHLNYETKNVDVKDAINIALTSRKFILDEILIQGNVMNGISHSLVVMDEIKKGSQPRNAADLFNDISGFSIQKRSSTASEPSLRAFKYEQMNIKFDGATKICPACPNRMDPITSHIIPEEVGKIEIVKGPFTVRFGQTFGGVVNMVTTPNFDLEKGFHGTLQSGYETNGSNSANRAEIKYANDKFIATVNGEYRQFGNYTDGNGILTSAGFKNTSYSLKLGYKPTENQILHIDWRQKFGRDIYHVGLPMDSPFDDSDNISLDYKWKSNDKKLKSVTFKTYYAFVDHFMTNGYGMENPRPNYPGVDAQTPVTAQTMGGKLEFEHTPTDGWLIYYGLDMDNLGRDGTKKVTVNVNPSTGMPFATPMITESQVWQGANVNDYGVFAEGHYKLSNHISLTAGLRTDYVYAKMDDPDPNFLAIYGGNVADQTNQTWGGHFGVRLHKNDWNVQLTTGRGERSASMTERYIYRFEIGSDSRQYIGNPYLKPEVNYQTELLVAKSWEKFKIGGSTFISYMDNYIVGIIRSSLTAASGGCGGGAPLAPKQYFNVNAYQYGFDAFMKWKVLEPLELSYDIAYTKARNLTLKEPLAQVFPMDMHVGIKYEKEKYWAELRGEFVSAQKDFAPSFNETETPGYNVFDIRLGYKPIEKLIIGLSGLNLLDEAYYSHLNFSFKNADEHNGMKIYEPGRNFSLFVTYNF